MTISGSFAIALPLLGVAADGAHATRKGAFALSLKLPMVIDAGAHADHAGSAAATLGKLSIAAAGRHVTHSGSFEIALRALSLSWSGLTPTRINGSFAVALQRFRAVWAARFPDRGMPPRIVSVTGRMYASGGALLEFEGPPNRGLVWSIASGSGSIAPLTDYTDEYGRAWARYDSGGYDGPLTVQVDYGA